MTNTARESFADIQVGDAAIYIHRSRTRTGVSRSVVTGTVVARTAATVTVAHHSGARRRFTLRQATHAALTAEVAR